MNDELGRSPARMASFAHPVEQLVKRHRVEAVPRDVFRLCVLRILLKNPAAICSRLRHDQVSAHARCGTRVPYADRRFEMNAEDRYRSA